MDAITIGGGGVSGNVENAAQVVVVNKQSDQLKAVVGLLLAGIQATPAPARSAHGTGVRINISA